VKTAPHPNPPRSDSEETTATIGPLAMIAEPGSFDRTQFSEIIDFFRKWGFVRIRNAYSESQLEELQADAQHWQRVLLAGRLPEKHGTVVLDDPEATVEGEPFAHYVCHITECSSIADEAVRDPIIVDSMRELLGDDVWLLDHEWFGVVYQDARPGDASGYSRIGWHTDWQSGPHLDMWPSVAFTIHLDATSPANGFLRVLPGSHRHDVEGMPPGFEKVPGEIALYADRGDILLHDAHLWHAAARATEDAPAGIRRHLRGGWYSGTRLENGHGVEDFVKNAMR
jgi:hypothetical protein